jgi:hypothetical protein
MLASMIKPTLWRSDKVTAMADISAAKNYVNAALGVAMAGKPVSEAVTRPYGCSVKYAH